MHLRVIGLPTYAETKWSKPAVTRHSLGCRLFLCLEIMTLLGKRFTPLGHRLFVRNRYQIECRRSDLFALLCLDAIVDRRMDRLFKTLRHGRSYGFKSTYIAHANKPASSTIRWALNRPSQNRPVHLSCALDMRAMGSASALMNQEISDNRVRIIASCSGSASTRLTSISEGSAK